jgi:hypothetical protein
MLKNVLIGTDVAYTTATNPSLLTAGQIGVYSLAADGTYTRITGAISAAQNLLPIVIAQGPSSGRNVKTFTINPKSKLAYATAAYVAPIPNVWVAGYDGVTATYDMNSGVAGSYILSVKNLTTGNTPYPSMNASAYFTTTASATSIAVSSEIAKQVNTQSMLDANNVLGETRFVLANVLSGAATAQLVTSAPANVTVTTVNGSPIITLSASTVGGTTAIVAGSYLRIGHATTTTVPIYKVKSLISATSIELETPYYNTQQALGTSTASVAAGWVIAATVVAAVSGVRFVEFSNRFNGSTYLEVQPNLIMNVSASGNLSGVVVQNNQTVARSYMAAAGTVTSGIYTEGLGTSAQVFKKELVAAGYSGFQNRTFIPDNFPIYTVAASTYNTIGLQFKNVPSDYTATGVSAGNTQEAILAIAVGTNQYADLVTILSSTNW